MDKKLILKNVTTVFFHMEDPKFGSTITIDATDPVIEETIMNWVKINNLSMSIKTHTSEDGKVSKRATFKIAKFVEIQDKDRNATKDGLGYGAKISMVVSSYDYNNNFGNGTSASVTKIAIIEPVVNKDKEEFDELFA